MQSHLEWGRPIGFKQSKAKELKRQEVEASNHLVTVPQKKGVHHWLHINIEYTALYEDNLNDCLNQTYLNKSEISPLKRASVIGVPRQAGTRYSKAGWAALKVCITNTVSTKPRKYATKPE